MFQQEYIEYRKRKLQSRGGSCIYSQWKGFKKMGLVMALNVGLGLPFIQPLRYCGFRETRTSHSKYLSFVNRVTRNGYNSQCKSRILLFL